MSASAPFPLRMPLTSPGAGETGEAEGGIDDRPGMDGDEADVIDEPAEITGPGRR